MKKLMFVNPSELSETITQIVRNEKNNQNIICEVGYSEEKDTDVAVITYADGKEIVEEVPIENFFSQLNEFYHEQIVSFDVYEVGDFGEGFAFSIQ